MKRYFIVKNEELIKLEKEFESMGNKINEAFKEFVKEHGIETKEYYQCTDRLMISPTENDVHKFKNQLKVDGQTFKKNSIINKAWVETCKAKELKTPRKAGWELADLIGKHIYRFRSSLFCLNDKVYGTFETDRDFQLPEEHFTELKASEFYKIVEEHNS